MIGVTVIAVGRLKEDYLRAACAEYQKRLGAFCKPSVVEIEEHRLPDNPSLAQIQAGLEAEGERILRAVPSNALTVALCIEGRELSSPQLAQRLAQAGVEGRSQIVMIIGGSHGLAERVKAAAQLRLSISPITFPHQLARVMVLEQLYRAFSINAGTKYHK